MPNRRLFEEAAVPEASQQIEDRALGSSLPDENEKINNEMIPDAQGTTPYQRTVIGVEQIHQAQTVLQKYRQGKANLENRIIEDEKWWELRHWEVIGKGKSDEEKQKAATRPKPTSAWLFNAIINKHADAMDNFPEPIVLPRERSDEQSAKTLSSILPVVMEYNKFQKTYNLNWWEKIKHGTGVYGVFWDSTKENGLGDISIKDIDLLKIFWEPGITDIQESRNLFITELIDTDILEQMYPDHKGKLKGYQGTDIAQYQYDDNVDITDKSQVVDWYYKLHDASGRTILHYCKFCCDEVLYASENDPQYAERGFYDHGMYPVVFDVMYPEKGTPVGFGFVSICKDPQLYIDELSSNILQSSMMGSRKRFFMSASTNVNPDDFADWNNPIVRVEGELGDTRIQEIQIQPIAPIYSQVLQMKIEELKDTSSNRDVNAGSSSSGITAASAIAALQEAGNKTSRDMISASYDACGEIYKLCIELMRQFYTEERAFRIMGPNESQYEYASISNRELGDQPIGVNTAGETLYRRPTYDLKVKAQKRNPFSTMEANQRAQELYGMGFFSPERAQEAMGALEMMEFEGIDKVKETVAQGQTLLNIVQQQNELIQQLAGMTGMIPGGAPAPQGGAPATQNAPQSSQSGVDRQAGVPMTSYGQRLAARSKPNMDAMSEAANPARI